MSATTPAVNGIAFPPIALDSEVLCLSEAELSDALAKAQCQPKQSARRDGKQLVANCPSCKEPAVLSWRRVAGGVTLACANECTVAAIASALKLPPPGVEPIAPKAHAPKTARRLERRLTTECAADVTSKQVRWAWPGRFAFGKITILDGEPGLGKTQVATDLLARLTTGSPMPGADGEPWGEGANVLFVTYEDDHADTVRPRFEAAGADLTRVHLVKLVEDADGGVDLVLPDDLDLLRARILELKACAVVIDPLMAATSDRIDSHKDQSMRRVLSQVRRLAEETGAAFILVRHLRKAPTSGAINAGQGTIGIIGAARTAHLVARDPEDPEGEDGSVRVFAPVKSNLARKAKALRFQLVGVTLPGGVETSRVEWLGESTATADQLVEREGDGDRAEKGAIAEAAALLRTELRDGPRLTADLKKAAKDAGIAWRSVERAKRAAGAESFKARFDGQWEWRLTKTANSASEETLAVFAKTANATAEQPGEISPRPPENTKTANSPEDRHQYTTPGGAP